MLRLVVGYEPLGGRLALLGQPAARGGRRRRGRRVTGDSGTRCLCGRALERTAAWQSGKQRGRTELLLLALHSGGNVLTHVA